MATTNAGITPYVSGVDLPQSPYENNGNTAFGFNSENRQYKGDTNMAQYNAQLHQAELMQQRQWALQDAEYNAPAALRKRLEEAGYNPALMAGAVQSANAPIRQASANTPGGQSSNMSGYHESSNQALGNVLQAGQNLTSSMLAAKQSQQIDADINLKNSESINTLSNAAKTKQDKEQAAGLYTYQVNAMQQDIFNKMWDNKVKERYYEEQMPEIIKNLKQDRTHSEEDVKRIQQDVKESIAKINQIAAQNKLTEQQTNLVNQEYQKLFNENSTFDKDREIDNKRIENSMNRLRSNLMEQGINPDAGGLYNEIRRSFYSNRQAVNGQVHTYSNGTSWQYIGD